VKNQTRSLFGTLAAMVESHEVDGLSVLRGVAMDLYQSLDTPVALSCAILLRYDDLNQLVRKVITPESYNNREKFERDYQAVSFLRKVPFKVEGLDPETEAKKKFFEAEARCKGTNSRLRHFVSYPERADILIRKVFCLSIEKIQNVLSSKVRFAEWLDGCRFGPGSFTHPKARGITSAYDKLQVRPSVTHDFREQGAVLVMSSPSWARSVTDTEIDGFWPFVNGQHLDCVPGNRVMFVPKTATTERAIAVEPLLNVYAQLGLGSMIRSRLASVAGIDLSDQTVNQQLAREGSIRGFLSTIDLSSASDTIARELVRLLLPEEWYKAMDVCRSKVGLLDGEWIMYEKFSSMGNGFTFELETLIFWALVSSTCEVTGCPEMVSVYGDDIVVPSEAFDSVKHVLEFFGFDLNLKKSFKQGVFRESCGKDFYEGKDVRPFLQEEIPQRLKDLFKLCNGLRRRAHRSNHHTFGCDVRYKRAWEQVLRAVPSVIRNLLIVPAHAADGEGIVTDWDVAQRAPHIRRIDGWCGWFGWGIRPVPVLRNRSSNFEGAVATLLYRSRNGSKEDYSPADPRQGREVDFRLRQRAYYGPWTDLGAWI